MKPTQIFTAENSNVVFYLPVEPGTTIEDVLVPEFWAHVSRRMSPGNRIEIFAQDFWAMLIVRSAGKVDATVQVLQHVELGAAKPATSAGQIYDVVWRSPTRKWGVVRLSDRAVVKDEFQTKEQALEWVRNRSNDKQAA